MTFDRTREAAALGGSDNFDRVAVGEHVNLDLISDRSIGLSNQPELF
jgi:hypothetical protein